jgi:hypothetical protein
MEATMSVATKERPIIVSDNYYAGCDGAILYALSKKAE